MDRTFSIEHPREFSGPGLSMVVITFPDKETQRKALGFLAARFHGKVLKSGEHIVPEAALEALARENLPFFLKGRANYEQQIAAV